LCSPQKPHNFKKEREALRAQWFLFVCFLFFDCQVKYQFYHDIGGNAKVYKPVSVGHSIGKIQDNYQSVHKMKKQKEDVSNG
jgi:hypothetical protein